MTVDGYVIAFGSAASARGVGVVAGCAAARPTSATTSTRSRAGSPALNPHLRAFLIALVGAVWIWFAGIIIAQATGMTDWSPISGMALLTVVLVLLLAGTGAVSAPC